MPNWYDVITKDYITRAAIGYMQDAPLEVFDIFPRVDTQKVNGLIPKYKKSDWFKIGDPNEYKRYGSSESAGDDFGIDSQSYLLEQYSFHKDITQLDVQQMESPFVAIDDGVKFVINRIKRMAMKELMNAFLTPGVWGNEDLSVGSWSLDSDSDGVHDNDPVADVLAWQQDIESTTGFKPNKLMITPDVYKSIRLNSHITNRLSVNDTKIVTKDIIANLFDIDKLVIFNAVNEDVSGYIAADKALLAYTPTQANANKFEPSAGYIMTYKNSNGFNISTNRIEMPMRNYSLRMESDIYLDPVIPAADCGYYLEGIV